jgi:hypothetical protein
MTKKDKCLAILRTVTLVMLGFGLMSNATAGELVEELKSCSVITDDESRLKCLDKVIAQLPQGDIPGEVLTSQSTDSEPQEEETSATVDASLALASEKSKDTQTSSRQEKRFGIENREKKEVIEKIHATIIRITERRFRDTTYQLDNGQTWVKKDGSRLKIREGDKVYIERGALGSFYLGKKDQNTRIKVDRL